MRWTKVFPLFMVLIMFLTMIISAQNLTNVNSTKSLTNNINSTTTIESKNTTTNATTPINITTPESNVTQPINTNNTDNDTLPLHTIINPAFAITGAFLIVSGLPLAFIGHRCTWYVAFISGFYSSSIVVLCLILRFGQARAVNDPSNTVEGLFVLACFCAGIIGGILFIIFRQGALLINCALGGFAFSLFLQACKSNGLIDIIGFRYLFFIAFISLCFALACHPKLNRYLIIFSTSIIGASATILGIDCFIRANLKEFYIRNVGFDDLFSKRYPDAFANGRWPLSPAMVIELGVLAGCFVMAIALQGKMWVQLKASIQIMRRQDQERQERERQADQKATTIFARAQQDLRFWKKANKESDSIREEDESPNLTPSTSTALQRYDTFYTESENKLRDTPQIDLPQQTSAILSPNLANSLGIDPSSVALEEEPKTDSQYGIVSSDMQSSDPISDEIREKERYLQQIAIIRRSIQDLRSSSPAVTAGEMAYSSTSDLNFSRKDFSSSDSKANRHASIATMPTSRQYGNRLSLPVIVPDEIQVVSSRDDDPINKTAGQRSNSDAVPLKNNWNSLDQQQRSHFIEKLQNEDHTAMGEFAAVSGGAAFAAASSTQSLTRNLNSTRPQSMMLIGSQDDQEMETRIGEIPSSTSERRRVQSMVPFPTSSSLKNSKEKLVISQDRIIIGAPTSSHFTSPPIDVQQGGATSSSSFPYPPPPVPVKAMLRQMTGNELQARHNKRLSALQKPLSDKVNQEAALTQAKQEWQKRQMQERKRWQEQEQQRINASIRR